MRAEDRLGRQSSTRRWIHEDLVRAVERTLEHQVQIMLDRFDRTNRLIRLGVATLAGMVAISGFLFTQGLSMTWEGGLAISVSVLLAVLAIFRLVRLNTALHREQLLDLGPDPEDMLDEIDSQNMDETEYADYKAHVMPTHAKANLEAIRSISARQEREMMVLVAAVFVHIAAIAYIIGGGMVG